MPLELTIPAVGESITEVQIVQWLKSEGDFVRQDEPVAVMDSEKSTFELPSPQNGRLSKILRQAGETVPVGAVVAQLEPEGASEGTPEKVAKAVGMGKIASHPTVETAAPNGEPNGVRDEKAGKESVRRDDSPREELSVPKNDPSTPATKPMVQAKSDESSMGREEQLVPMTMLRRTASHRLVEAQKTMAMLTTFNEADMSAVQALRKQFQEPFEKRYQVKLGLMSFFVKAAIDALKQFPQINAEIRGNDIAYRNFFDIGVAVSTERGLIVPVLRDAGHLSFAELEKAIGDFSARARNGAIEPDELAGGTFTITNGGVFGSLLSTPIINPPQAGILGLHSIQERPIAVQGQVVIRPMMYLALTYDHRIVDGREAVLFLRRIKETVETPARMLVEI